LRVVSAFVSFCGLDFSLPLGFFIILAENYAKKAKKDLILEKKK